MCEQHTSHVTFSRHLHALILLSHRHWLKFGVLRTSSQASSSCAHVVYLILRDSPLLLLAVHRPSYRLFYSPGGQRCGGQIPCALSLMRTLAPLPSTTLSHELDRLGNDAADEAADLGRRRVGPAVVDARRTLSGVCARWCPVIVDFHLFFIAISRAVVNHDGNDGTAPDPMVLSAGALPKRRRLVHAVRDLAMLPGPPAIWVGDCVKRSCCCHQCWGYCSWALHSWSSGEVGCFFFQDPCCERRIFGLVLPLTWSCQSFMSFWAGERLTFEKAHPRYLRPGRPIPVSAVSVWSRHWHLALLSFHRCYDAVTLFAAWWAR